MGRKYRIRQVGEYYSVRAASLAANVVVATLDAGQALDGVTLAEGDYVLLKAQTTGAENGIYRINADGVAASRPTTSVQNKAGYRVGQDVAGTVVRVEEGTVNAGKHFLCYKEPAVIGTDAPAFIETDAPYV